MTGKLYIDSIDSYTKYAVSIADDAFKSIIQYPALKEPDHNDWHEEDGIEVDLSDPKLDGRKISIPFNCEAQEKTGALLEALSNGSYHTFIFSDLSLTLSLRLVSQPDINTFKTLRSFSLEFSDDSFFLNGYTYVAPTTVGVSDGYEFDGLNLSLYGIRVLEGTSDEIQKSPAVKTNKNINLKKSHGLIYESSEVKFQSKEVKLYFLMKTSSLSVFGVNYKAFLYDLIRAGERNLYTDETSEAFKCYYKSSSVSEFLIQNGVWCKFDVTLVFTSFRNEAVNYLLSTQVGQLITEQDGLTFIDMES